MRIRLLYKFWAVSLAISVIISGFYVYIATKNYISSLTPGEDTDFAALPYLVYGHIVGVVCTGFITAFLVILRNGFTENNKKLASWLISIHVFGGVLAITLLKLNSWIFFFNPLAFALFGLMPYVSWSITNRRINSATLTVLIALIVILVVEQIFFWASLYNIKI